MSVIVVIVTRAAPRPGWAGERGGVSVIVVIVRSMGLVVDSSERARENWRLATEPFFGTFRSTVSRARRRARARRVVFEASLTTRILPIYLSPNSLYSTRLARMSIIVNDSCSF